MSRQIVNFCYRTIRVNKVYHLRSRMQPFWLLRSGEVRPTGFAREATAFVERQSDRDALEANGYPSVILLQPGVNCRTVRDEFHVSMPCLKDAKCL